MTNSQKENEGQEPGQPNSLPGNSREKPFEAPTRIPPEVLSQLPPEVLSQLPPEIRQGIERGSFEVTTEFAASMAMYQGPWPPPSLLAEYEANFPGWGIRMLELTEKQVAHRQGLEVKQAERMERRMDAGQMMSFGIAAASLLSATLILTLAPSHWATSIAALGVVIVGVGGPAVARILATKFNWPGTRDKSHGK